MLVIGESWLTHWFRYPVLMESLRGLFAVGAVKPKLKSIGGDGDGSMPKRGAKPSAPNEYALKSCGNVRSSFERMRRVETYNEAGLLLV